MTNLNKKLVDDLAQELNLRHLSKQAVESLEQHLQQYFSHLVVNTALSYFSEKEFQNLNHSDGEAKLQEQIFLLTAQTPGLKQAIEERLLEEYQLLRSIMHTK